MLSTAAAKLAYYFDNLIYSLGGIGVICPISCEEVAVYYNLYYVFYIYNIYK